MTAIKPIVSIGDLVADLIVSIPHLPVEAGHHQVARSIRLEPGGGANFLISGARLGYPMAAIGALGDDVWGHQVAALVQAEGVDLAQVRHEGTTTQVVVLVSQAGEHVFLGAYGHGPRIDLSPADRALITNSGALFCAGYTLCESRLVELTIEALRLARTHAIPVFFDPGPQMSDVPAGLTQTVLDLVDTVLLTEEEIPLLTDRGITDLLARGPRQVVVKRGAAGCVIWKADQPDPTLEAPAYPVEVVDTSAAGDSFNAAYIGATLQGRPLAERTRWANAVGAAKVRKLGSGRNVPTLAEVEAIFAEFK